MRWLAVVLVVGVAALAIVRRKRRPEGVYLSDAWLRSIRRSGGL
jgi:hypothetical protein